MSNTQKRPYAEIAPIALSLISLLSPYCERIEIAGSLRRERPLIGDIEIVALPKRGVNLFGEVAKGLPTQLDAFLNDSGIRLLKNGALYKKFEYRGVSVDLFLPASPAHWGCVYMIRTGSHKFNMWIMTQQARRSGVKFEDGLLYDRYSNALIPTPEERDVFAVLDIEYIEPPERDGY